MIGQTAVGLEKPAWLASKAIISPWGRALKIIQGLAGLSASPCSPDEEECAFNPDGSP